MHLINGVSPAGEDHGYVESMSEAGLVVDAATGAGVAVRKIGDEETRSPNLSNDLIVNLVEMLLSVDAQRFVTSFPNGWLDAFS